MITRGQFDKYKDFREQAGCPFCMRKEVLSGDGLFYCNLDKKFNPLKEKIIKKFKSKWWFFHIFNKETTSYYAWYCERCHRYWIEDRTGKMIKEITWEIENIPNEDKKKCFTTTPREAVMRLAEKANEFFEQEYNNPSNEIHSIIKTYSEFLAKRHMDILNGRHNIEVIKPLCLYSDKLTDWVFTTIQRSLKKKFPYRADYIHQVLKVHDADTKEVDILINDVCTELSHKLMSGFVMDLWQSMKEHYERILQSDYPFEYNFLISKEEGLDGVWSELYGRSIKVIFECLKSLGLDIPALPDKEKIILGTNNVNGINNNIVNYIVFGESNINSNIINQEKMGNNKSSSFEDFKVVGNANITRPTEDDADYKKFDVGGDLTITTVSQGEQININNLNAKIDELCIAIRKSEMNNEISIEMMLTLKEAIQAIQDKNSAKQQEVKRKLSEYWNIAKDFLQGTANATKIIEFLMKVLS
ncbi:MAG: hypothetical protein FWD66_10390 [Paludibacter sp.]|nr:hypothetical protein [Paludibacter sp.]